ncbi:tetratricopeptide repeat protein [Scytonema tolypothrichoides VB-61278]|nr:tetratricopeptide repeat protein [Scytonema tolypothrichoides VB-61278]
MRRKACIFFIVLAIMMVAAQSAFAAPTRLGKIVLVTPKNKRVQIKRNGKWVKVVEGADLYKDDLLKPQSGVTAKILCTASSTNFLPKRVPEEIPSSVNSFCRQQQVSLLTQRVITNQHTEQNGSGVNGSSTTQTSTTNNRQIQNQRSGRFVHREDGSSEVHQNQDARQTTVQNGAATDGSDQDFRVNQSGRQRSIDTRLTTQETITSLETLIKEGSQAAFVYRQLGDLYQQTNQQDLAQKRYLKAVELATTAKDVEEKAGAQAGLGELYAARGNVKQAVRYLKNAQTGYESLGNKQQANTVRLRVEELTK